MGALRIVVFFATILAVAAPLHGYLWFRLVRSPGWPPPWDRAGAVIVCALFLILALNLLFMRDAPRGVATALSWGGFTWLGLLFLLFVLLLVTEPFRPIVRLLLASGHVAAGTRAGIGAGAVSGVGVGVLAARIVALFVLAAGLVLGAVAVVSARLPAGIRTVPVHLARWPAALAGYTIVQVSDVHVGETVGGDIVERIVRQVGGLKADMIVITGDLVDGNVADLAPLVAPIASLRAPDGVFFITGNHEYYSGADAWVEHIRSLGIRVLRNERLSLHGENGFDLAGTDDYSAARHGHGRGQDIPGALAGRDPNRPVILLAHQPRSFPEAAALGVDLQLAGHTHGGQIYPFHYLTRSVSLYLAGLFRRGNSQLYVSRGTGYWGPPMRLGAPSEITRIVISP